MIFQDDLERERRRRTTDETTEAAAPSRSKERKAPPGQVGDALRTVYQRTIDEAIPPEMLDLLGKLG